jgi:hypothetical protein
MQKLKLSKLVGTHVLVELNVDPLNKIILPDKVIPLNEFKVIMAGPDVVNCKVGDYVATTPGSDVKRIESQGKNVFLMWDSDIFGIYEAPRSITEN